MKLTISVADFAKAAKGAKSKEGIVTGVSPAGNKIEHLKKYKLPTKFFDAIL